MLFTSLAVSCTIVLKGGSDHTHISSYAFPGYDTVSPAVGPLPIRWAQQRPYTSVAMAADPGKSDKYGAPDKITVSGTRLARATAAIRRLLLATPEETSNKAMGDRTYKLGSGTTSEYGRYVNSLRGARDGPGAGHRRIIGSESPPRFSRS